jgi:hypothetical protein
VRGAGAAGVLAGLLGMALGAGTGPNALAANGQETPLPDLVVRLQYHRQQPGQSPAICPPTWGVSVEIANFGEADAGPLEVEVNEARQRVDGLAAGQTRILWFRCGAGDAANCRSLNTAMVDAALEVDESDETNNHDSRSLPVPPVVRCPFP